MTLPEETRRSQKITLTYVLKMCQKFSQNDQKGYYFERKQIPKIDLTLWKICERPIGPNAAHLPAKQFTMNLVSLHRALSILLTPFSRRKDKNLIPDQYVRC